jgi:hypothetical protein
MERCQKYWPGKSHRQVVIHAKLTWMELLIRLSASRNMQLLEKSLLKLHKKFGIDSLCLQSHFPALPLDHGTAVALSKMSNAALHMSFK